MFVDQITIFAKAGDGGNGVSRWRHEKFKPMAGPSGGNGGRGGDIIMRSVRDVNLLAKYTGEKKFFAEDGEDGMGQSRFGKNGNDLIINIPVGSIVKDVERGRVYEFMTEGHEEKIFKGGGGGLGNEYFKSSINRSPEESTNGRKGEGGELEITLSLVVDVGVIGMPNAGKSTLLNAITNARSKVGDYPFTTLEPHLGDLYGYVLADIPGLIIGASEGKGLGHTFLRHISHTKMLLHLVSLEDKDFMEKYFDIRNELKKYNDDLLAKEEWIIFTKKDLVNKEDFKNIKNIIDKIDNRVFVISTKTGENVKGLSDALVQHLRES